MGAHDNSLTFTLVLANGDITMQGDITGLQTGARSRIAVTGGTGRYAKARGFTDTRQLADGVTDLVIHLNPRPASAPIKGGCSGIDVSKMSISAAARLARVRISDSVLDKGKRVRWHARGTGEERADPKVRAGPRVDTERWPSSLMAIKFRGVGGRREGHDHSGQAWTNCMKSFAMEVGGAFAREPLVCALAWLGAIISVSIFLLTPGASPQRRGRRG